MANSGINGSFSNSYMHSQTYLRRSFPPGEHSDEYEDERSSQFSSYSAILDISQAPPESPLQQSVAATIGSTTLTWDYFCHLIGIGNSVSSLCREYQLNERAVRYQMKKLGFVLPNKHSLTEEELDIKVGDIVNSHPAAGHKVLYGIFNAKHKDTPITRKQLLASLNRIRVVRNEPPRKSIVRREYYVKAPLSMIHIDGHHKLIRYGFVVHAGIDGYSRVITFMELSTNNRASTVLQHFKKGVLKWGMPVAVRSDRGLENVGVADFMLSAREQEEGVPFITGRSVHNQRIERLWRDLFSATLVPFHLLFQSMEVTRIFNPSDGLDLYCLHEVSSQLLCKTVSEFRDGWNVHRLSTMNNRTPLQLFHSGLDKLKSDVGTYHPELDQDHANYSYAERESNILQEFNAAGQRRPRVVVTQFQSPLTEQENRVFANGFNKSDVTLENLREKYLLVKGWVISCIRQRG